MLPTSSAKELTQTMRSGAAISRYYILPYMAVPFGRRMA